MNQFETNIINSFRLAKSDIIKLQNALTEVSKRQKDILTQLGETKKREAVLANSARVLNDNIKLNRRAISTNLEDIRSNREKIAKKATVRREVKVVKIPLRSKKIYLASKEGKSVHEKNCPFAKNIKPKSRVVFKSKAKALNAGYRVCDCVKKH